MNFKTKIALMSAAGLLSVAAVAGYGTYALFTAQGQASNNTFTAGQLNITPERQDVPQTGPMFYTSSSDSVPGILPTGFWAPGDKNTRGLFLENDATNSTLTGRLQTVTATPANSSGTAIADASGSALNGLSTADTTTYNNDILFAKQANVVIWELKAYNQTTNEDDKVEQSQVTPTQFENWVDLVNQNYQDFISQFPDAATDPFVRYQLIQNINKNLLTQINDVPAQESNGSAVTNDSFQIVQMTSQPLIDFVQNPTNVEGMNITVAPGDSAFLAYTISMNLHAPSSLVNSAPFNGDQTAADNAMQGKEVYFNFGSNWIQAKNNSLLYYANVSTVDNGGIIGHFGGEPIYDSYVDGSGPVQPNQTYHLTGQLYDQNGQPVTAVDPSKINLTFTPVLADMQSQISNIVVNTNGTFSFTYTSAAHGPSDNNGQDSFAISANGIKTSYFWTNTY